MTASKAPQTPVKSALRTLDLIEYVVARPAGVTSHEISTALAIPVSSLSYLLGTLVERGYLHRAGRTYFAGPGLDRLRRSQDELSLVDRARPLIKALRLQLNETASLFELDGWEMVAVITETAEQTLRYSIDVGRRVPLHCVAAGKAALAALPAERLDRYFAETTRERFTKFTICERGELTGELAAARAAGFARTRDEYTLGISGVGAAVCANGLPIAAIGVAVPSPRYSPEVEARVAAQVRQTARALEETAGS